MLPESQHQVDIKPVLILQSLQRNIVLVAVCPFLAILAKSDLKFWRGEILYLLVLPIGDINWCCWTDWLLLWLLISSWSKGDILDLLFGTIQVWKYLLHLGLNFCMGRQQRFCSSCFCCSLSYNLVIAAIIDIGILTCLLLPDYCHWINCFVGAFCIYYLENCCPTWYIWLQANQSQGVVYYLFSD